MSASATQDGHNYECAIARNRQEPDRRVPDYMLYWSKHVYILNA